MMINRVSVLVTFYNQEKYVNQALSSVINQKANFGIKVLVGDDGSTDSTRDIVRQWMQKYPGKIEMYVMERRPGNHIAGFRASQNRLNLLKHVETDYFIYLDGDDYFNYDGKLQHQVDILDATENADCIACGHNTDMLYPDGRCKPITSVELKEGKYAPKYYWRKVYFHTDTLLIRSLVIPSINTALLENNFNDNMITFSIIQNGNLYYIPESWAVYLQTGDGIWTSGKVIVNHIRNMFLYDLCNQINPDMEKETTHRFWSTWISLYRLRNKIDSSELQSFSDEAKVRNMHNSYNWIHYGELRWIQRRVMCLKTFGKCWREILWGMLAKIYHVFMKKR